MNTAEMLFTLALGFAAGAVTVGTLWWFDNWRNRPFVSEKTND